MAQRNMQPADASRGAFMNISELATALCFQTGKIVMLMNLDDKAKTREEVEMVVKDLPQKKQQEFLNELDRLLRK
jgi:hypothetical protein